MGALITWIFGSRFALAVGKWVAIVLTVSLFLLSLRRSGERAGRLAERLENMEKANEIQRQMPKSPIQNDLILFKFLRVALSCA